jgi:hypothetical protein
MSEKTLDARDVVVNRRVRQRDPHFRSDRFRPLIIPGPMASRALLSVIPTLIHQRLCNAIQLLCNCRVRKALRL